MKKAFYSLISLILTLLASSMLVTAASASDFSIDTSKASTGVASVKYSGGFSNAIKVQISKSGTNYTYDITSNTAQSFPLQMGAGEYTITTYENVTGNKYKAITSEKVNVSKLSDSDVYTNSIQLINFNGSMVSIKELNKLVVNAKTDKEKIEIIYEYIVENFSYDDAKAASVSSNYIPVIDTVYSSKTGICYDYSALFAAILRANNIPTKLLKGYSTNVDTYHAWNQVYIDGSWVTIDTTYDSSADKYEINYTMNKKASDYKVSYQY